jgi:hypothetical protein
MRGIEPQVRNCAPGNLQIPGSHEDARPGMTLQSASFHATALPLW